MHQNKNQNKYISHEPVLISEVLKCFKPQSGESYLDLTAGYGGHAKTITDRIGSLKHTVLVDRDESAVKKLKKQFGKEATIMHQDFLGASRKLVKDKRQFDLILADLGVSSPHLNEGNRGFSITKPGC